MKRQLDDYYDKFYNKLAERRSVLFANNYAKAREIAQWKELVAERWENINVVSTEKDQALIMGNVHTGQEYKIRVSVDEQGLDDVVGVELVVLRSDIDGKVHVAQIDPFKVVKREGNIFTFEVVYTLESAGDIKVAYRMFPKNADLPHRQDFCYVKWFN